MALALVFSLALLGAVLVSEIARRSILSTAVLFVVVGFGAGALGWVRPAEHPTLLEVGVEIALLATLFTDGLKLDLRELRSHASLAMRALLLGLPLTLFFSAVLARWLLDLGWTEALLVGAALAPTDPVFAASIIGSESVPSRLRHLLNIESGLNDGLAVPFVLLLLGAAGGATVGPALALADVLLGLVAGATVPLPAVWLVRHTPFGPSSAYRALFPVGVLLVAVSVARFFGWNALLAAFAAGVVLGTISEKARRHYAELGDNVTELLKLAALLVFAASIEPRMVLRVDWEGYAFALTALVLPRGVALTLALIGSELGSAERIAAAWIGPRGFASVLFGLLILHSSIPNRAELFRTIALVVVASVLVHSTTDYFVERRFERVARAA